jgi:hypothetical protein
LKEIHLLDMGNDVPSPTTIGFKLEPIPEGKSEKYLVSPFVMYSPFGSLGF